MRRSARTALLSMSSLLTMSLICSTKAAGPIVQLILLFLVPFRAALLEIFAIPSPMLMKEVWRTSTATLARAGCGDAVCRGPQVGCAGAPQGSARRSRPQTPADD